MVRGFFDSALEGPARWHDGLVRDLSAVPYGKLTAARLDEVVRPYAAATLSDRRVPVYGAGFVAATDLLPDRRQHLSWWQGPDGGKLTLTTSSFNKERLDYSEFEWYRIPMHRRQPHIAGPSVDYLCCDEYTMTAAVPVMIGDRFLGIAGVDLLVSSVERHLLPLLRREQREITLINDMDRIILSTDLHLETGGSVHRRPTAQHTRRERCGSHPLTLLIG